MQFCVRIKLKVANLTLKLTWKMFYFSTKKIKTKCLSFKHTDDCSSFGKFYLNSNI